MSTIRQPLRIAFLHPSLGLGGAERLVVNAARHLQSAGHQVTIFTTAYDPQVGFGAGGEQLDIRVRGAFLPARVWFGLEAVCSIGRMSYLAISAAWSRERFDVVFCDLVPYVVPLLKRISSAKILFYCHFPDQLLAPHRGGVHRPYRSWLARLEARGMRVADRVVVNSRFTEGVVRQMFAPGIALDVLYPAAIDERDDRDDAGDVDRERARTAMILSVNRFERKKRLELAIEALRLMKDRLPTKVFATVRLVMTGACDERIAEHREVLAGLETLVQRYGFAEQVTLAPRCTEAQRRAWLAQCLGVIYTPPEEHFGLGPVEAMAAGRPVVGVASGGLLETVRHEETGLLCAPTADAFADALGRLILDPDEADRMGRAGRRHVFATFSRARFGAQLDAIVDELMRPARDARGEAAYQRPSIHASQSSTSASAAPGAASRRAADDIAAKDAESRSN